MFSLLPGGPDLWLKKKKNTQQHSYTDVYNREPAWQFPATALLSKTTAAVKSQMPTQPKQTSTQGRSVCNCLSWSSWVRKTPWRRERLPTPVFLPGEFHGQSSLADTVHGVAKSWTRLRGSPFRYSCWRIPWTGEPGGLQSTGLQRVGHDWACLPWCYTKAFKFD